MKQLGYYHVFPFDKVEKGSSIIIYGIGEVGENYLKQIEVTDYCNVEFVTDSNYKNIQSRNAKLEAPEKIKESSSTIIIANGDRKSVNEIISRLKSFGIEEEKIIWDDIIIAVNMVFSDRISTITKNKTVKKNGAYHIFPFNQVCKGDKIIVWGMGEVGQHYYEQISKNKYCEIVSIVDNAWQTAKYRNVKINNPNSIKNIVDKGYKFVIANGKYEDADRIKTQLIQMNVKEEDIIYNDYIITSDLVVDDKINNKVKMPYLNGCESKLLSRTPPVRYAKSLMSYDVISFDVFDTVIFRPFVKPTDLFMIMAAQLEVINFVQYRIDAEKKAREISMFTRGNREVSLKEICHCLSEMIGYDEEKLFDLEVETEMNLCFANPYMFEVYKILKNQNKRIVFTSNMYWKKENMLQLLTKCGYKNISLQDIFVSCDFSVSKGGSGELFNVVRTILGENLKYIHIGDNFNCDVLNAKKKGFDSRHYKNVNELGNQYRAIDEGMSDLVGSAYGGIINSYLHNGLRTYNRYYEYGFIYGGLFVLGYAQWIQNYAKSNNIDKVLFLARDGDIYKKIFDILPDHVDSTYVLWSRLPAARLEAGRMKKEYINKFVYLRENDKQNMSIRKWLSILHIEELTDKIINYQLHLEQYITKDITGILERFLIDNWEDILRIYENEDAAAKKYFKQLIGEAKHIALVDVGWAGSCEMSLRWLIEEKWNLGIKVDNLIAGAVTSNTIRISPLIQKGTLKSYLFSQQYNTSLHNFHLNLNLNFTNTVFELFSQSDTPSFESYSLINGKVVLRYGFPEVENHEMIKSIQSGIIDFAKEYSRHFEKYPYMLDISGNDAYSPFKFIANYPDYFMRLFEEYSFYSAVGTDFSSVRLETVGELIRKFK